MSYAPPSIGTTGLSIPAYSDILNWLIQNFRSIYGSTVYLGADSVDYQDIAVRALQASDVDQALASIYLSFNPLTAIGTSLDLLGQLIGTVRKQASFSSVLLTLTGTPATVINNGTARDTNGNFWNLPATVTIGGGGTGLVTATAQNIGNITANPGAIAVIATPTAGWTAVNNASAAIPGVAVEPDSAYRARLLISQSKPSLTLIAGTAGAIAAVQGVTRSVAHENPFSYSAGYGLVSTSGTAVTLVNGFPFDSTDASQPITINGVSYTISSVGGPASLVLGTSAGTQTNVAYFIGDGLSLGPAHSITCVVEGGASADIAQAIYGNKNPGCLTNGTTSVTVVDPLNGGISIQISFDILSYIPMFVFLNVHALAGFTSATQAAISAGIVNYLNSLEIGESVVYSELYGAALTARPNPDQPLFSIRQLTSSSATAQTTANTNISSAVIAVTSAAGIVVGQIVTGNNIPPLTTVVSIASLNITISANPTSTATGVAVYFFTSPGGTSDIFVGYNLAAQGASFNVVVDLV